MACVAPEQSDDVLWFGQHAAGAPQIVRDRDARRKQPLGCDVAECVGLDLGQALAQCPQPCVARKAAEVR